MTKLELPCTLVVIIVLSTSAYAESTGGIAKRLFFDGNTGNLVITGGSFNINGINQNSGQHCMTNWMEHSGSCYLVVTQELNWQDAYTHCINLHAKLAEIETFGENMFLETIAMQYGQKHNFWIGATDKQIEGEWRWASSGKRLTFMDWNPKEPNNKGGRGQENCLELHSNYGFRWNDISCTYKQYFICEM